MPFDGDRSELVMELAVPASPEYIAVVRLVVSYLAGSRRNLADERIDDLKLAVSEACTNAIEAHAAIGRRLPVVVQVWEAPERLEIRINDRGPGFDPDALRSHPPVTDPERLDFERGLGIPLIRTLVDHAQFVAGETGGTSVRLILFGGPAGDGDRTDEILRAVLSDE